MPFSGLIRFAAVPIYLCLMPRSPCPGILWNTTHGQKEFSKMQRLFFATIPVASHYTHAFQRKTRIWNLTLLTLQKCNE